MPFHANLITDTPTCDLIANKSLKGNCTGPNTCTCPEDYTGEDCRIPVCDQNCLNGGYCVAPNTCQCPPGYSGYDCSMPVCHQGFFMPHENLPQWMIEPTTKSHWLEYQPCNYTYWCNETHGFDCAQTDRHYSPVTPHFGMEWRYEVNSNVKPQQPCAHTDPANVICVAGTKQGGSNDQNLA